MKKLVPDPPRLTLITNPAFSIHTDMIAPDPLVHASALLLGVAETLDEHCRARAGAPGLNMLANAAQNAETARALVEHALNQI
ncbi:hypothetical protein [Pseudomonas sp. RW10S2]|uniref:hypothetical protein n=1 Tax=Pseudomonas sp. RW10S2 TaxID=459637 RepID=UPI001644CE13|nr:hypothetical protein [Pseudomonas sp. RW10S2]MBC3467314.1 hypothetical protein [Pseudomonas sp. RW10S2]